jgi:polypeptide N-acetylgalactosaminyltransferase
MDPQHKEYFYTREPSARFLDMGDISEQLALKERLECKSFQWFMENVAYDVYDKFPQLPENVVWGELINSATMKCFDAMGRQPPSLIGLQHCHGYGNNQLVRLNAAGQLSIGERCVEADGQGIKLAFCRTGTVDGPWRFNEDSKTLFHRSYQKCIAVHPVSTSLSLMPCDVNNSFQQWRFKIVKPRK